MKHHHYLTLTKVLITFTKERNSPKEADVLKEITDNLREYIAGTTSQPTAEKADD